MAKDRRNKERPTLDLGTDKANNAQAKAARPAQPAAQKRPAQPAQPAAQKRPAQPAQQPVQKRPATAPAQAEAPAKKPKKKKKKPTYRRTRVSRAATIIRCVLAVLIISMLIFFVLLGMMIYKALIVESTKVNEPINATTHEVTPTDKTESVAYYVVGLLGENDTDAMPMLSVVCHDKVEKTLSVMQIPSSTYITDSYVNAEGETVPMWDVETAGKIYGNPKAFRWCENDAPETCRRAIYEPEITITEEGVMTHSVCGTALTTKKGSATESLAFFVNEQIGLPVDGYFIMEPATLVKLIGYVGGVNIDYSEGAGTDIRLVGGEDALAFMNEQNRADRQRQVFAAILQRIFDLGVNMDYEAVKEEVVQPLMDSSDPIRTEQSVDEINEMLQAWSEIGLENMNVYLMPSETTYTVDGLSVYSVHSQELLDLLNTEFRPHMTQLTLADITLPEIANTAVADIKRGTLSEALVEQVGAILDETAQADVSGEAEETPDDVEGEAA